MHRVLLKSVMPLLLLASLCSCQQPLAEKTYTGQSNDEFAASYTLTLKQADADNFHGLLRLQQGNLDKFVGLLNSKWHDEGKLKLAAYNSMQDYCQQTRDPAACASLEEFSREVNSPKVTVFYKVLLYDAGGNLLETLNTSYPYNLQETGIVAGGLELPLPFKATPATFAKIHKVELIGKL